MLPYQFQEVTDSTGHASLHFKMIKSNTKPGTYNILVMYLQMDMMNQRLLQQHLKQQKDNEDYYYFILVLDHRHRNQKWQL
jgi:hypothetical protein